MNRRSQSTRRSLATRISLGVASRLSVAGQPEVARHGTVSGVVFNTLCNVMGAGVLSLPLATYNASALVSVGLVFLVAFLACYAVYCLVSASDLLQRFSLTELAAFSFFPSREFEFFCGAKLESGALAAWMPGEGPYPTHTTSSQPASHASAVRGHEYTRPFAHTTRRRPFTTLELSTLQRMYDLDELQRRRRRRVVTLLVEGIIFLCNFGSLVIYCKVVVESIPAILTAVIPSPHDSTLAPWLDLALSTRAWALVTGFLFFLLSCTRDMEELKWSSLLGFLTIFYIVCAVAYRFGTAHANPPYPDVPPSQYGTIRWAGLYATVFRAMATYGLAFSYHVNVPYFYKELREREPGQMMLSVVWAFPIIVLSYIATGLLGYLTFGDLVASPQVGGNIVANYASDDKVLLVGRVGLCLHFACVFPIVSISTRRGLHRLAMTLLTWEQQSETMMLAAGLVLNDEDDAPDEDDGRASARSGFGVQAASATTPLLAQSAGLQGTTTAPHTALVTAAELDRDAGSPDDTTRLAIVVEAFVLVLGAMLLALLVPGISFVMDIVGTLFSLTLMLVLPGAIGLCVFSTSFATQRQHAAVSSAAQQGPVMWPSSSLSRIQSAGVLFDSSAMPDVDALDSQLSARQSEQPSSSLHSRALAAHRFSRLKRLLCVFSVTVGIVFTVVGATLLAWDHWPQQG